ncbi:MAG: site-specific integrase [Pseudonocardiales bacterium]|nr:site-specific integrase [Pseudonocardiales bacterium]MBV9030826.1 site-specific integrase [Pseudonocardiales bacterium]
MFATDAVTGGLPVHIAARVLGHHNLATTQSYLAEGSGIAPDGRETPGHQIIMALERRLRPICSGCLSRADT